MRSADDVYIMPRRIYFPSLLINVCRTKLFKPSVLVLVTAVIRAEAHNLLGCSDFHFSSSTSTKITLVLSSLELGLQGPTNFMQFTM